MFRRYQLSVDVFLMEKKSLFSKEFFWLWTWESNTPGGSWKDPVKQSLPVFHSVCPGVFLSCAWQPIFLGKNILPQKFGKWTKNGQYMFFFNLLKSLVINLYWIFSTMKICCVPAQIPYLGKILFLRRDVLFQHFVPKYSQPIRLQDFLISHISIII